MNFPISSGVTSTGIVLNDYDNMYISSGGTANRTTVSSGGYMYIYSGGTANSTTVSSGGAMYISSGGTANSTTVSSGGTMSINGTANSTTAIYEGDIYIGSGGTANNTTLNNGCGIYISKGGTANSTTVNFGGSITLSSAGTASNTIVNSGGKVNIYANCVHYGLLTIEKGATVEAYKGKIDFTLTDRSADDSYLINNISLIKGTPAYTITVAADQQAGTYKLAQGAENFTGTISVGDGTTEYGSITVNGDAFEYNDVKYILTQTDGNLLLDIVDIPPKVFIYSDGILTSSGTEITDTILQYGGNNSMHITSGGVANSTTINCWGGMEISAGGTANSTTVNLDGFMNIHSGGTANSTTNNAGHMRIYTGGTANNTILDGGMYIFSGGTANSTAVNSSGCMFISSCGTANSTTVNSSGRMFISSGGTANSAAVNAGGSVFILSCGTADTVHVSSGGGISVDGNVTNLHLSAGAYLEGFAFQQDKILETVENGSAAILGDSFISGSTMHIKANNALNNICQSGGSMLLEGTVYGTTMLKGGMYVHSGGRASQTEITSDAQMTVYNGGWVYGTAVNDSGVIYIEGDNHSISSKVENPEEFVAPVVVDTLMYGGYLNVRHGSATGIEIRSSAKIRIYENGVAQHVSGGGKVEVYEKGVLRKSELLSGGSIQISSGGTASDTTVSDGGVLYLSSGGIHKGLLQLENGAVVSAYEGAKIDFTLTDRSSEDGYLINNLSLISGAPTYTITVSENQEFGTYKLAQGAENFTGTISVGDGVVEYGSISVNGDVLKYKGSEYKLTRSDGNLELTVGDFTSPDAPVLTSDMGTRWANVPVQITADGKGEVVQYSFDGESWEIYTDTLNITSNGEVFFRCVDEAGNISDTVSCTVDKIDPVADLLGTEYIFINAKYNGKITGKTQNGVPLVYGNNAFISMQGIPVYVDLASKMLVTLDGKVNGDQYADLGVVAGTAVTPTVKETADSYSYTAKSTARGTLEITKDTGSTEFIRFATVNLTDAKAGNLSGGNSSSSESTKSAMDKKGAVTETEKFTFSSALAGKFTGNAGSAESVAGFSTVNLTGTAVAELSGGTEKTSTSSKVVDGTTKDQKNLSSSESTAASGKVTLKEGAFVETVENYQNVTLTGAEVEKVTNFTSKDSKKESATFDEAKNKVTRSVTLTHTESTSGTLKATGSTLGDVTGFATVNLKDVADAGNFSRVDENGAAYSSVKETVSVKTNKDYSVTESYKKTETFIRSGKFTAANSNVGDIENFSTVTLDRTSAQAISNFVESKIVTEGSRNYENMEVYGTPEDYASEWQESELSSTVTTSLNGSVTLKNGASAVSISNFKSVAMTDSSVENIFNVGKVTVNKGESSITSYTGSSGNDTLTIAKGAVLTAETIDLKEGKDTLSLNGTLILTGTAFNVDKISGKGEIAANEEVYADLDIEYANVLDLGKTSENFRGTAYETADDNYKKAVKWDGEESFTGWLGSWEGGKSGSDTVDHIRFKAEEGFKLEVSDVVSWTLLDKNGNDIGQAISAAGEYILELRAKDDSSVAYTVQLT